MIDRDQERMLLVWGTAAILVVLFVWLMSLLAPAHSAPAARVQSIPGYPVGEFTEPPTQILTTLDGQEMVTLQHLLHEWPDLIVPVTELRLVNPTAKQSRLGARVGVVARRVAARMPSNRRFLPSAPRVACAAFTSYILKQAGGKPHSYAVNTAYPQLRKRGGKIIASRVSTRYVAYYKWYKPGDFLFFHKGGNRLGHQEIYVGNGMTAGTSSSMLRVGIRRVGNRGYDLMTVMRI